MEPSSLTQQPNHWGCSMPETNHLFSFWLTWGKQRSGSGSLCGQRSSNLITPPPPMPTWIHSFLQKVFFSCPVAREFLCHRSSQAIVATYTAAVAMPGPQPTVLSWRLNLNPRAPETLPSPTEPQRELLLQNLSQHLQTLDVLRIQTCVSAAVPALAQTQSDPRNQQGNVREELLRRRK